MKTIRDTITGLMPVRAVRVARCLKPAMILAFGLAAFIAGAQPSNDNFANAWVLSGATGSTNGDSTSATLEACETNALNTFLPDGSVEYVGDPIGASVWFAWTAPASGKVEFDTFNSDFDTVLAIWTTTNGLCDSSLTNLVANDDDPTNAPQSSVGFDAVAGVTYYVQVSGYSGATGNYFLNWSQVAPVVPSISSGSFKFTQNTFYVSQSDSSAPILQDGGSVGPSSSPNIHPELIGGRITVTRSAPAYGRVLVDYTVSPLTYTNYFTTNYFGTNVISFFADSNTPPVVSATNTYFTNIVVTEIFSSYARGYQTATLYYGTTNSATEMFAGVNTYSNLFTGMSSPTPTNLPVITNYTVVTGGGGVSYSANVFGYLASGGRSRGANPGSGLTITNGSGFIYTNLVTLYTNTFFTNFFGTNIFIVWTGGGAAPYAYISTNYYFTNIASGYIYSTNSVYTNGIAITNQLVVGTNWINSYVTNLFAVSLTASNYTRSIALTPLSPIPQPTNNPPLTPPSLPIVFGPYTTNTLTVQTDTFSTQDGPNPTIVSSANGIPIGFTNTLTFNNLMMSQDIMLSVNQANGPDSPQVQNIPGYALVTLLNPRLDTNEDATVVMTPGISTTNAYVNALSVGYAEASFPFYSGSGYFNLERSFFVVQKNVSGSNAVISVYRGGTNIADSVSVDYILDPARTHSFPFGMSPANGNFQTTQDGAIALQSFTDNQPNTFVLQAGSDYATPGSDFTIVSGTLSWAAFDIAPKQITIPIMNNGLVENNEDFLIQLHNPLPIPASSTPGMTLGEVNSANVTILYDDTTTLGAIGIGQQPAGAVDRSWNKDGALDSVPPNLQYPGTTPGFGGTVYALAEQPDGRVIIAGSFVSYDSTPYNRIVRVLQNGYQDSTFQGNRSDLGNNSGANDAIYALALQPDGKIIVGGNFTAFNGFNRHYIARLNTDGSVDSTFNPGLGANGRVWSIALESNGQIVIGGEFSSYNGTNINEVARLNADGSLDATFNPGAGPDGLVDAVAVDGSGRIIIGGNFANIAGISSGAVARLNLNGSPDTTFTPGIGTFNPETFATDPVHAIVIQADGKIILGGSFSYYNLATRNGLVRLNTDGTLDLTFHTGTGTFNPITAVADTVYCMLIQPDGNILIGGNFMTYNQTPRIGFARVFQDGTLDTSFLDTTYNQFAGVPNTYFNENAPLTIYPYSNARNAIYALALETSVFTSSNLIVGGSFGYVGGGATRAAMLPRSNVARVIGGSTPGPGNMELSYSSYSVNNSDGSLYVSLVRTNGNLGIVSATLSVTTAAPGPGIATPGTDFSPSSANPVWDTAWWNNAQLYEMASAGPNYALNPGIGLGATIGNPTVKINVFNPGNISGNLSANFALSQPISLLTLGGENIPVGAALGAQDSEPLTIIDSNIRAGVIGFTSPSYLVVENGSVATITLTRTNGSDNSITVFYSTTDGTGVNGVDYTGATNQVTFAIGQTNASFQVPTLSKKTSIQADKTVYLHLFTPSGGATLSLSNATLTLINPIYNYGHVSFSLTNYIVNENAGSEIITVNRLGGNTGTLGITLITANGTATNGINYIGSTNQLFWNNGDATPRTVTIPILADGVVTSNLVASLILTNAQVNGSPTNTPLSLGGTNALLTIVNTDSAGSFQFSGATYGVKKYAGYALIPVTRTGGSVGTASVTFVTVDDTAVKGVNYTYTSNTLIFANGELSKFVSVPILLTGGTNGLKDLFLQLSNPTGFATIGTPNPATLYIIDSDSVNETPGSPDPTYSGFAGFNGNVYAMKLQPNNQLVVGGDFTMANGVTRNRLARLNSDGTLDAEFSLPSSTMGANDSVRAVALQSDGRILVGGFFTNFNSVARGHVARLNSDGTLDSVFNPGSGADNPVYAIAQSGNKVLIGGAFASVSGVTYNGIAQLNNDGTPDSTFNTGGLGANATVYALAVQSDGKIVIGGDFTAVNGNTNFNHIARLNADGSADTNFVVLGNGPNNSVRAIALQLDGKILIGGVFTNVNGIVLNHVARLNANGSLDTSFTSGVGASDAVFAIGIQNDERIVLGGEFTSCSGVTRNRITRLNPDGTVDPSINFGYGANDFISALAIQEDNIADYPTNVPDEKIIIGGGFTQYDNQTHQHIARIFGGSIGGSGAFQFSAANYQVDEMGTNVMISVLRTGGTTNAPAGDILVTAATSNGSAIAGINYSSVSVTLDFPLGEVLKSFLVPVSDDGIVTTNLTVNLGIFNPTPPATIGNQPTAVLTIINDDSTVSFSSANYSVPKNIVSGTAAINIIRLGGTNIPATVNFSTSAGSAVPGTDYSDVSQTVTFAPGVSNVTVYIPIINNGIPEGNRTINLQISNISGSALIGPTNAVLTIIDTVNSSGELVFSSPTYSITEGGGIGYTNAYITVNRIFGSSGLISVGYTTSDGSALSGVKYLATNGVLTFGDGETSKMLVVPVINTPTAEGPEYLFVVLTNATGGATLASPSIATLTILNTNTGIAFASAINSFTEPSGLVAGTVSLNVVRYNNTNGTTTVNFSTTNGTAIAGTNFDGITNGLITFNSGDSVKSIVITTHHDPRVTGDLFFTVGLANPSGSAQLTSPTYTIVTDHDADAGISFVSAATNVYRNAGFIIIPVICSNTNVEPVSVNYATGGGTAVAGADYTPTSGTLTFTNGRPVSYFTVVIPPNNQVQSNRTFNVSLSAPTTPGVLLPPSVETVTIIQTNTPYGLSFLSPIVIGGLWGTTNANNTFGAPEIGDPNIAGYAPSAPVWFQWTAPAGIDGEVALDTIGSFNSGGIQLDTVLGVFSGTSLANLNQVAANDDLYPQQINEVAEHIYDTNQFLTFAGYTIDTNFNIVVLYQTNNGYFNSTLTSYLQPESGPSGLRFTAKGGGTYYIAADAKVTSTYIFSNGLYIPVINGRGQIQLNWAYHPAGVFRFATEKKDVTGITDTNGNPILLYEAAESEGGLTGSTLHRTRGVFPLDQQDSTIHTSYSYDVPGMLVTVTRAAGAAGRVSVDYTTTSVDTNLLVNGDAQALPGTDYTSVQGTLIFDDYEMSKTILIPIQDDNGLARPNRDFMIVLSNPQRDPGESSIVSLPRIDSIGGRALCRILDCDIDPKGPTSAQVITTNITLFSTNYTTNVVVSTLYPTNAVFNFGKANYRVARDLDGYWNSNTPITVYVNRSGTNRSSQTVYYRFDNYYLAKGGAPYPSEDFPLQPGSDYAVPTPATSAGIRGDNSDFDADDGSLSFPGGNGPDAFYSQPIQMTLNNNRLNEFNKDIHIGIYLEDNNGNPIEAGMVAETTVTILFDDTVPLAGSVDELYNPDYPSDLTFNTNTFQLEFSAKATSYPGADHEVYSVAITTNDEAIIGGAFGNYTDSTNTYTVNGLARLFSSGFLDTSFNPGSGLDVNHGDYIRSVALSQDQVLIGGHFKSYNGVQCYNIARVNSDGSLDSGFSVGDGANGTVWSVLVQPDGKVIIGGEFTNYNGAVAKYVARLNTNGTLDSTFNTSNILNGPVYAMALSTNSNQLLIGGLFQVAGQSFVNVARLNSDGSLDTTFQPGSGADNSVLAVAWQTNNQALVGGAFKSISGTPLNHLARLNADGSIDASFQNGTGADNLVNSITLDSSGLIYVGGSFQSMNGTHRLGFARLYSDGTLDTSFLDTAYNQFAGLARIFYQDPPGTVYTCGMDTNGNVIIGGSFQEVGGGQADKNPRARLEADRGLIGSTTNQDLSVSEGGPYASSGGNLEPKSRDGVRNRSNLARLITGATPGPGNIGMVNSSYAVNKTSGTEPVSLVRANGQLGYAGANFSVLPSLAQSGTDYSYNSTPPVYPVAWENHGPTRMHSDGLFGADGLMQDRYGETFGFGVNGPASVTVNIFNNSLTSGNLSAQLQLANPIVDNFYLGGQNIPLGVALGESQAPLSIIDDTHQDGVFGFASPNFVRTNSPALVDVTRTNGSFGVVQVSFQTTTNGSTAVLNADYRATNGVLTFSSGQTDATFPVTILNNSSASAQEKVVAMQLYNIQDLSGGRAQLGLTNAFLRLINPNFPGYLSFSTNAYYGNLSSGVINFTVTRTVGSKGTLTLQYRTFNGTAVSGTDYLGTTNTLTWNNGDMTARTVSIPLLNNSVVGPNKQFAANLFNAALNGTNTPALFGSITNAVFAIVNDNSYGAFQFSAAGYQFNENGGYATINVVRSGSSLGTATVNYNTVDGTAFAGTNYVATNNTLTFLPGQVVNSFNVQLLDDGKTNPPPSDFYFAMALSSPSAGAALGSPTNSQVHLVDAESYNQQAGSVDTSFDTGAGMNASVLALALQSSGQILAAGNFTIFNGTAINRIARLNTDGTLDGAFLNGLAGADSSVNAMVSQTDDRVVVGGSFSKVNGVTRQHVARLMTDGSLDTSFNSGAGADSTIFALAETFINGARGLYVGGAFSTFNGISSPGVVRLDNSGAVDNSFAVGQGANGTVYAVAVYPTNSVSNSGKILVGGSFTNFNGSIVGNLARLNADGSLDTNFNQNVVVNNAVRSIAIQLDGSVLIGGNFTNVNGTAANHIARLNSDGTLDAAFAAAAIPGVNGVVNSIAVQTDNRIVLAGQFSQANGVTRQNITRLLPTGAVDPTINFGLGANGAVNAVLVQPADGNLVLGGDFTQFNGQPHDHIVRLYGGSMQGSGAFQFTASNYQVDENGSFATITIQRTGGTSGPNPGGVGDVFVAFTTANGSAVAGVNYAYTTNYLDFPVGEVIKNVYVPVMDDLVITTNLTVNLLLNNPTLGTALGDQAAATLTIINDDSVVQFFSSTYSVPKNTLTGFANIKVVRVGGTSGSCTVNFATGTNGTAVVGTDYYPTNALVTFNPGDTSETVLVAITNNLLPEGNRTISLALTNAANTLLASPSNAMLTIIDTVQAPGDLFFTATNFTATASDGVAYLSVGRINGAKGNISATYTTLSGGSALAGQDYVATTNSVTFSDGDTNEIVTVPLLNSPRPHTAVSLTVSLSNPSGGALTAPTNTTLVIYNTNAIFNFTVATNFVPESSSLASIVVQRSNNTNIVSTVNYATTNGTALAGINYSNTAGTLTFGLGEIFKSIPIPLINRSNITDLVFGVALSSPTRAQLNIPSNTVVVLQGAATGVSFPTNTTQVQKNAGSVLITVVCSNPRVEPVILSSNDVPLKVNYLTRDGTAKAGINYQAVSGTLVFTNGNATNTFFVPIFNNQSVSGNQTFSVVLTNVTYPGQIAPYGTQAVVVAESNAGLRFSQTAYSVFKNASLATINVYRTGFTDSVVSVDYFVTNGTAIGGQNFYPTNGTLFFTNGMTSQSFNVQIIANGLVQPNLFALLRLANPTNYSSGSGAQIVNPGAATLTIIETGGSYVVPAGAQLINNSSLADLNAGVIGSNDTVQVLFAFRDSAGLSVTNLIAYLLPTNGVISPTPTSQTYGPLTVYSHSVSMSFTFTARGTNSTPLMPTFQLYDGGKYIGPATFNFTLGTWTATFANTNMIIINDKAAASPYPSLIDVSGVGNVLVKATVTLTNVSHSSFSDIDALVASPTTNTLIMAHVGGVGAVVKHVTLTFDDASTNHLPQTQDQGLIVTSTNKPTAYGTVLPFP